MTNKFISMMDGIRQGIASVLTPRCHRSDSLSIVSRQSLLPIFLLCLTLFIGAGQMWGATESITANNAVYSGSGTSGIHTWTMTSCTVVQAKGTSSTNVNSSYPNRWYQNNTITFTPKSGYTISKIELNGSSTDYNGQSMSLTTSVGSLSTSSNKTTWTGSATSAITIRLGKQFRFGTVTITYSASAASHTLSSAVSPAASGSVELSSTSVAEGSTATATATPATHYVFDHWSISGTGSTLSSTTTNPTTVTMGTANATVTANFTQAPKASITLSEAGATTTDATTYYVGDQYTLPSSTEATCNGKVLVGWSTVTVAETNTKPTSNYYEKGAKVTLASTQTFYAVFATASGGGSTTKWVLTALDAVTEGTYALVNQTDHAFNGTVNSSGHGDCTTGTFTFVNGEATSAPTGTCEITIATQSSGFSMYNTSSEKYLYASKASSGGLAEQASKPDNYWCYYNPNWEYYKSYSGSYAVLRSYNATTGGLRVYGANNGDGVLRLAKKTTVSSVTYSAYSTTCCQPLASINGSVF